MTRWRVGHLSKNFQKTNHTKGSGTARPRKALEHPLLLHRWRKLPLIKHSKLCVPHIRTRHVPTSA